MSPPKKADLIGSYHAQPYPISRTAGIDTVDLGRAKHHIPILFEVDVTAARVAIRRRKEQTGEGLSFTGWAIKCLAQAVSENRRVQAMRQGRKRLVVFDNVNVSIAVNRAATASETSENLPMPYVIRKASEKSVEQIHAEIRAAQTRPLGAGEQMIDTQRKPPSPRMLRVFFSLPGFMRRGLFWNRLLKDPFYAKRTMGTVNVTSVGMFAEIGGGGSWGIPAEMHPLLVALGGIARKPGLVGDRVEPREVLGVSVLFDHDVVDGALVAVFLDRFRHLMEGAFGL